MAELVIARVTEQGVQARDLSETFSGDNELIIKGQQGNAGGTCVANLNGVSLSPSQTKGLNCIHLTEDFKTTPMSFDFGVATDTTRFINWVNGLSTGIILLMSHTENVTNKQLDDYFDAIGTVGWKYYWNPDKGTHRSSYVAIIDCSLKKIMTEQFMGHGKTTMQAQLCVVFDTFADIGVTGYGDVIAWEEEEKFVSTKGYSVVRYVDDTTTNLNVKPGEYIEVSAEVWNSAQVVADGAYSSVILQFFKDSGKTWISSVTLQTKLVETWVQQTKSSVVPANCDRIAIQLYRYPNKPDSVGTVGVRDMVVKLRKPDVRKDRTNGTFGQWGFITANANAAKADSSWVASSKGQDLITHSYEELDQEWLPDFQQNGHFDIPDWIPGSRFEISQTISYQYPKSISGASFMRSGMGGVTDDIEDRSIKMGIRTVLNSLGEAHTLYYSGLSAIVPTRIEYGIPYTYKITVDGTTVKFYVDGVEYPSTGTLSSQFRQITHFSVGAEKRGTKYFHHVNGTVHDLSMIDKTRPTGTNDRYYNFVLSGQLDDRRTVPGRSRHSGLSYFAENLTPDNSAANLYCGPGSKLVPGGLSDDSTEVFVTITDTGGNTLNKVELNKRYACRVFQNTTPRADWVQSSSQYFIMNPVDVTNGAWIVEAEGKNANTLKVRMECVTSPKINGNVTNVDWVNINKQSARLNGTNQCADFTVWKGPGEFQLKFNTEKNGSQYIIEGRNNEETSNNFGGIYINSSNQIVPFGGVIIATINGMPFVTGMKVVTNTDYLVCGYIRQGSQIGRIGARYNNVEYFAGYIWDLSLDGKSDKRYYRNYNVSRYEAHSNYIRDTLGKSKSVYQKTDLSDYNFFTTATRLNSKAMRITQATTPTGAALKLNVRKGSMIRISFDVETKTDFEFRCSDTTSSNSPLIKSFKGGRRRGSLCHIVTVDNPGIYIRSIAPTLNENIIVNRMSVSEVYTDAIISNATGVDYTLDNREAPVMKTNARILWVPKFDDVDKGYLVMKDPWVPDPTDWAIRVKCKAAKLRDSINPIISGAKFDTSTICIDQFNSTSKVRVYSYNSKRVLNTGVTIDVGTKENDLLDIYAKVSDKTITLTVNGKSISGPWNPEGTESVSFVGAREGFRYINDIYMVELIDTGTKRCNSRRYDLRYYSTVQPTITNIENELGAIKFLRIGEIDAKDKIYGWDGTKGEEFQIGRMKDSWFIGGYQVDLFTTINTSGYSAYLHFVGDKRPFNSIDVELYQIDENNNEQLFGIYNANQSINSTGYGIPENEEVRTWFSGLNTNKKVIFRPKGNETDLTFVNQPWVAI